MFAKTKKKSHIPKMDSETDFSSNSNYNEFANEIQFVGDVLQPFQFEPIFISAIFISAIFISAIFISAEIQAEKDLVVLVHSL